MNPIVAVYILMKALRNKQGTKEELVEIDQALQALAEAVDKLMAQTTKAG